MGQPDIINTCTRMMHDAVEFVLDVWMPEVLLVSIECRDVGIELLLKLNSGTHCTMCTCVGVVDNRQRYNL